MTRTIVILALAVIIKKRIIVMMVKTVIVLAKDSNWFVNDSSHYGENSSWFCKRQ